MCPRLLRARFTARPCANVCGRAFACGVSVCREARDLIVSLPSCCGAVGCAASVARHGAIASCVRGRAPCARRRRSCGGAEVRLRHARSRRSSGRRQDRSEWRDVCAGVRCAGPCTAGACFASRLAWWLCLWRGGAGAMLLQGAGERGVLVRARISIYERAHDSRLDSISIIIRRTMHHGKWHKP
eukprot:6241035-Prymnesium_polylepis.1